MIDIKKSLTTYMTNFKGGWVGFFDMASEVINDLGTEWTKYAETENDDLAAKWAVVFMDTAKIMKDISGSFMKLRDEFDKRELEKEEENPQLLIENFKNKIANMKKVI
jgi:hypothetical protein